MPKKTTKKPDPKTGDVNIGGNVEHSNIFTGNNNVLNFPPEHIKINSLHQLPPPLADFTGRKDLLQEIISDFEASKGTTISGLTGLGGIGKTALGLQVAQQVKDTYPDAQIFLDLKGTTTPLTALDIARHVILSFEPSADLRGLDENNMQAVFQSVLSGKRALLYFDNARSAEQIAKLIPPPTCAVIVTSRWTFPVAGLKAHKVGVLEEKEAQEFLLELCPRIAEYANELAKACGYLPLALRIAGSYLQVNSNITLDTYVTELASLKSRLAAFTKSHQQAELTSEPDVFAAFELSYNQLNDDLKKKWRTLGIFPAPFDNAAVTAMWEMEDVKNTEEILSLLMRYSLIDFDKTSARYELHDLLAEFAREKLEREEEHQAHIRHAVHYSNVLGYLQQMFEKGGDDLMTSLRLYDLEWAHIEFGQRSSVKYLDESKEAAEACNQYAWQGSINYLRLMPKTQILWIENGLKASKKLNNKQAQGAHLGNLGSAYYSLGEVKKAIQFYEQALVIDREIGDRRGEGADLGNLGNAYRNLGEVKKAIQFYEQALVIDREIGDRRGEGADLGNLGNAYRNLGEVKKAIQFYEQGLEIAREIGDRGGEGNALGNLGNAYAALGEVKKAIQFYEQGLEIAREIGDRRNEGNWLGNLGLAYADLGEVKKAIQFYEQRLVIAREIGDRGGEGNALGNLGLAYADLGEVKKAIQFYEQALEVSREIGDRGGEGADLGNLGSAYAALGEVKKAIQFYEQALEVSREIGDRGGEGNALGNLGNALYGLGEKEKGIEFVKQALAIFEAIESPHAEWARNKLKAWGVLK